MKKLLAIILIMILMIPAAFAEDLAAMSDADLKALYKSVKEEMMNRKLWDEATLPAGVYQAGKNLPEGTYECVSKEDNNSVILYASYEDFLKDKHFEYFYPNAGESFVVTLYGEICYYIRQECTVRPFVGFSW